MEIKNINNKNLLSHFKLAQLININSKAELFKGLVKISQMAINTRHEDNFNFLFKRKYLVDHFSIILTIAPFHFLLVILVGDTGVGKTHLLSRYIKNELPKNKYPTIGVEFATKGVTLKAGGTVKA